MVSSRNRSLNDGTAIATRMITGTSVHITSSKVLWVVRDGVGLARELKRTTTITNSASTKIVIAIISQSRKSWNQMIFSMTGVAACWNPICQGDGCPEPANAAPPIRSPGVTVAARAANRLSTSIVVIAPSTKSIVTRPGRTGGVVADQNPLPIRRPWWGRAPRQTVRREGNSRASQTIIPAQSQCEWTSVRCDNLDIFRILPIQGRKVTAGGDRVAKTLICIVDLAGRPGS